MLFCARLAKSPGRGEWNRSDEASASVDAAMSAMAPIFQSYTPSIMHEMCTMHVLLSFRCHIFQMFLFLMPLFLSVLSSSPCHRINNSSNLLVQKRKFVLGDAKKGKGMGLESEQTPYVFFSRLPSTNITEIKFISNPPSRGDTFSTRNSSVDTNFELRCTLLKRTHSPTMMKFITGKIQFSEKELM